MQKWEYGQLYIKMESIASLVFEQSGGKITPMQTGADIVTALNILGQAGWELVAHVGSRDTNAMYTFRRPIS